MNQPKNEKPSLQQINPTNTQNRPQQKTTHTKTQGPKQEAVRVAHLGGQFG